MMKHIAFFSLIVLAFSCQNATAPKDASADTQSKTLPVVVKDSAAWGTISGNIVYPSDAGIPEDYRIAAFNIANGEVTTCAAQDLDLKNNTYRFKVKAGQYYLYSFLISEPDRRAYYDEFVTCGLKYECKSHDKIVVSVKEGETKEKIDPADWYVSQ